MKSTRIKTWILLGMIVIIVTSCAPGSENFSVEPAGFFMGLWHGLISLFTFIISLFSDSVEIYEANNNGGWYNINMNFLDDI